MPQNGYSIGRDVSLRIITGNGVLRVGGITGFQSRQEQTQIKIKPIDGSVDHLQFFDGWMGSFDIERKSAVLDRYFNQIEANYFSGIQNSEVTIMETVVEVDGSTSRWIYRRVLFQLEDAGEWAGDKSVKQRLAFVAARRQDG